MGLEIYESLYEFCLEFVLGLSYCNVIISESLRVNSSYSYFIIHSL